MSEYIHKSHNVTVLIYHLVLPAKYRRVVFDDHVDDVLKEVCLDIEKRYQIKFLEIGTDMDHVHFLVQSVPTYSVTKIVTIIPEKSVNLTFKNKKHSKHWRLWYHILRKFSKVSKFLKNPLFQITGLSHYHHPKCLIMFEKRFPGI